MKKRDTLPHCLFRAGFAIILALAITLAVPLPHARAGEPENTPENTTDIYNQMIRRYDEMSAELQHALNEIEGGYEAPAYPKRVLSMRKNASVTIGGELRATYAAAKSSWKNPFHDPAEPQRKHESKTGDFGLSTTRLSIDARAGDRWRAFLDINLNGFNGAHPIKKTTNPNSPTDANPRRDYDRRDERDYINQAYAELMKADHSGFGAIFGQVKLPFGLWQKPNLFAKSFLDAPDLNGSYLMHPDGWDNGVRLPHASRFLDPAVAAMLYYEMRDIVRFDAAIFQERKTEELAYTRPDGTRKIRSESSIPRSWQIGMSIQPLENWELTAHFRNRYSRSKGIGSWANSPYRWDFLNNMASGKTDPKWDGAKGQWSDTGDGPSFGARSNEQAVVVGLAVEIPTTDLSVSVEYAHGWNQGFNKYINSDSVNLAFSYKLTPRLTLHAQGEWLHVKDRSWMAESAAGWSRDTRNHHLYRVMLGAEYELARFMTLEAGWQYEYWKARSSVLGRDRVTTANMVYFGTRFVF